MKVNTNIRKYPWLSLEITFDLKEHSAQLLKVILCFVNNIIHHPVNQSNPYVNIFKCLQYIILIVFFKVVNIFLFQ